MAPLIDMVFILLIFYIVSTSFVQDAGVQIERPQSSSGKPVTTQYLPVAVTKSGSIHVAGQIIDLGNTDAIQNALAELNTQRVVIQADREVTTGLLLGVIDACKAAGAESVEIATIAK